MASALAAANMSSYVTGEKGKATLKHTIFMMTFAVFTFVFVFWNIISYSLIVNIVIIVTFIFLYGVYNFNSIRKIFLH